MVTETCKKDPINSADDDEDDDQEKMLASSSLLAYVEPIPAQEVFARDALPLYLPELEAFLSNAKVFPSANFSDAESISTDQEKRLYNFNEKPSSLASRQEVCGDQIVIKQDMSAVRKRKHISSHCNSQVAKVEEGLNERVEESTLQHTMFPPFMLLKDASIDELKSNAVGPRKPPGGFLGSIPGAYSIIATILDFVIGVEGSTIAAGFFRLQLFMDFAQMMNLQLHFNTALHLTQGKWTANDILLRGVPAFLALNFVSVFGAALVVLFVFVIIVGLLLIHFWRISRRYNPNHQLQGYDSQPWIFRMVKPSFGARNKKRSQATSVHWKSTVWTKFVNVSIIMLLNLFYIPLGRMAIDALVWGTDYWPDGVDPGAGGFCYESRSTEKSFNWAFIIIPVAASVVIVYTLWFPVQMMHLIKSHLPRVDEYNELGNLRSKNEMELQYMRMLGRDRSPISFMYNAYRRTWGAYKPIYLLFFKFSSLVVVTIFTPTNCLFHKSDPRLMLVIQQAILIGLTAILFVVHIFTQPFVDMLSNRSELVNRVSYLLTAVVGLIVALRSEGDSVYKSAILYVLQGLSYSASIYYTLVGANWASHLVKRLQGRIDFSIDVYSPHLNLDMHVKRRIWQETISVVLLSAEEYRMPYEQNVTFSVDEQWPPYLLQFRGTAAERHVENLKIVKAIGLDAYENTVAKVLSEGEGERWSAIIERIQKEFAGPDAYWQPLEEHLHAEGKALEGVSSFFGKAFLVPFPPTLVISYDQTNLTSRDATVQLRSIEELEMFIYQNKNLTLQQRKWVRVALRALDGQKVRCPYVHTERDRPRTGLGSLIESMQSTSRGYSLTKPTYYSEGILSIRRRSTPSLGDYNFDAGFDVSVTYTNGQRREFDGAVSTVRAAVTVDAATAFGLRDDFEYTKSVQAFFCDNETTIAVRFPQMQRKLHDYRMRFRHEAMEKRKVMTYAFMTNVFDAPITSRKILEERFVKSSRVPTLQQLPTRYNATTSLLLERFTHVNRTSVHQWWYVFWDDFWRQNQGDYAALRKHKEFFCPYFPTSIAYEPMSRARLESMLKSKEGLWQESGGNDAISTNSGGNKGLKQKGVFSRGFLNRIFFMLDEIAFKSSSQRCSSALPIAVAEKMETGSYEQRSIATMSSLAKKRKKLQRQQKYYSDPFSTSSRNTGGGTVEDRSQIVERYAWPWTEQRLTGMPSASYWTRSKDKILQWLSIHPYKLHDDVDQLYIYLECRNGRYEAIRQHGSSGLASADEIEIR